VTTVAGAYNVASDGGDRAQRSGVGGSGWLDVLGAVVERQRSRKACAIALLVKRSIGPERADLEEACGEAQGIEREASRHPAFC
jgi:hypothetical protein